VEYNTKKCSVGIECLCSYFLLKSSDLSRTPNTGLAFKGLFGMLYNLFHSQCISLSILQFPFFILPFPLMSSAYNIAAKPKSLSSGSKTNIPWRGHIRIRIHILPCLQYN
jgi:hypothetical protein